MKMKEVKGNLWTYHIAGRWICVTTNGFVKKNGHAVMGRGCAFEATQYHPKIAKRLGALLANPHRGNHCYRFTEWKIITFPTKHNWYEDSDLSLIKKSLLELRKILFDQVIAEIYLPRPGCSNGKLDWEAQVKPLIQEVFDEYPILASRVIIISKEGEK